MSLRAGRPGVLSPKDIWLARRGAGHTVAFKSEFDDRVYVFKCG